MKSLVLVLFSFALNLHAQASDSQIQIPLESTFSQLAEYYAQAQPTTYQRMSRLRLPANHFDSFWQAGLCKFEVDGKTLVEPAVVFGANGPEGTRFGNFRSSEWETIEDDGTKKLNESVVQYSTGISKKLVFPVITRIIHKTVPDSTSIVNMSLKQFYQKTRTPINEDILIQHPQMTLVPGLALSFSKTSQTQYAFFKNILISKTTWIKNPIPETQKIKDVEKHFKQGYVLKEAYCFFPFSMVH